MRGRALLGAGGGAEDAAQPQELKRIGSTGLTAVSSRPIFQDQGGCGCGAATLFATWHRRAAAHSCVQQRGRRPAIPALA